MKEKVIQNRMITYITVVISMIIFYIKEKIDPYVLLCQE